MFSFLRIEVFRKKYIVYVAALLVLCAGLCVGVCAAFLSARAAALREEALAAFEQTEASLRAATSSIEDYVLGVYRNGALARDMEDLLESGSFERYLARRLDSAYAVDSIVASIQEFADAARAVSYSRITLRGTKITAAFRFGDGQSDAAFLPHDGEDALPAIGDGYTHTRQLASTMDMATSIGELRFLMTPESVFAPARQRGLPNAAVLDEAGNCYVITPDGAYDESVYHSILAEGYGQGTLARGLERVHYSVNASTVHGYRFVLAFNNAYLLRQNSGPVLIMVAGTLATYLAIMLIITLNMRQDAEFLSKIIAAIDNAKTATFHPISGRSRNRNEYGMIADSLDDMNLKLEEHIRTEYLLKLRQQEAEMKALQHQINPHFLYNTLEIIRSGAVMNHDEQVAGAITNLGQLYRALTKAKPVITLGEEKAILDAYLELMAFRHKESFSYRTELDPELLEEGTVKLWMQPIAENFFTHGFNAASEFNLFVLSGRRAGDGWTVEMMDNGPGIAKERLAELNRAFLSGEEAQGEGIGLRNVFMRLRYYYGSAATMSIRNNRDAGITVAVHVGKEGTRDV